MPDIGTAVIDETRLRFDGFASQVRSALEVLGEDELWQRPNPTSNSVGNLVVHLCGSTRHFWGRGVGGSDYLRDRPSEFLESARVPKAELLRTLDQTLVEAEAILSGITESRLLETTDRVGKIPFSMLALLLRVTHHWAVHTGQIVYVAKAAHPGALDELWMKTMKGR